MTKKFANALNRGRNITPTIKNSILEKQDEITLNIDVEELELNTEEKEEIINISKEIRFYRNEINKTLSKISETLYKAYKLFSNKKNGTFEKYFESEGLSKQFVYRALRRYNLFLEYKEEKIFEIGLRPMELIIKHKDKLSEEDVLKIINSENPMAIIRELNLIEEEKKKEEYINYEDLDYINIIKEKINNIENKKEQKSFIKNELKLKKDYIKELTEKLKEEKNRLKQLSDIKRAL